jgi:hypothetical protein
VKLASRELSGFIPSKCLMAPEIAKICQALKQERFYNAELLCEEVCIK